MLVCESHTLHTIIKCISKSVCFPKVYKTYKCAITVKVLDVVHIGYYCLTNFFAFYLCGCISRTLFYFLCSLCF